MLFVDLEGFSTLAAAMDPEDVRNLQGRYFETARAVVARYGGTLEKFIGDAVMAVWGAPTAHEDDAERAVRAALELVAAVTRLRGPVAEHRLAARAAVATGEAAVTPGLDGQGLVAGDLVNTAARLQTAAPRNQVLVDDATRRAAANRVTFVASGKAALRGMSRRLSVWTAVAADVGRVDRTGAMHRGEFVGRQRELGELLDMFRRCAAERRVRVVSIVGIAGIGKSRLAWELQRALDTAGGKVAVHVGGAPSYGDGITFAPLAEMVRRQAAIAEGTEPELARRQLAASLAALVADEVERDWIEPRLATLIDPESTPAYEAEELFTAWRRFFERISDWAPTLLIFENVQWAEPPMIDFIDHLATWSREHPIMAVALARPELLDRHPGWGAGLHRYTAIHLEPIGAADMGELLHGLAPDLAPDLVELIVRQAGGVPLYAVEVVRMLLDRMARPAHTKGRSVSEAVAGLDVPDSLRSLVAARLDALPSAEREVVHAAAVLGRRFHPDALAAVARLTPADAAPRIATLVRREILALDEDVRSPGRGKLSFVQDVVRDVAYRTLSRRERSSLHLAAAGHLERLDDDELVEAQAEHLYEACKAAGEGVAPATADRAAAALAGAARRAMTLRVPGRALDHLQRAVELSVDAEKRTALREEAALAARAAARFDVAEELLRAMIADAEARADDRRAARARAQLASVLLSAERHASATDDLERAVADMGDPTSDPVAIELLGQLARARALVGDNAQAIRQARRTLKAARALDLHALALDALTTLGTARAGAGDETGGLADLRAAVTEAEQRGIIRAELRARNNLAWVSALDDPQSTLDTARAGMELAVQMGVGDMADQLSLVVCAVAVEVGNWDEALALIDDARERVKVAAHRIEFSTSEAIIRGLRGDRSAAKALDQLEVDPETDAQVVAAVDQARAWLALLDGRLGDCLRLADRSAAHLLGADRHTSIVLAARAGLWSGDVDTLRGRLDWLVRLQHRGRAAEATLQTLEAGAAALHGAAEAEVLYERAVLAWRDLELPLALAFCLAERHALLGPHAAREWPDLREAERILTELGARGALRSIRRLARARHGGRAA